MYNFRPSSSALATPGGGPRGAGDTERRPGETERTTKTMKMCRLNSVSNIASIKKHKKKINLH